MKEVQSVTTLEGHLITVRIDGSRVWWVVVQILLTRQHSMVDQLGAEPAGYGGTILNSGKSSLSL